MLIDPYAQYKRSRPFNYVTNSYYPDQEEAVLNRLYDSFDRRSAQSRYIPQDGYLSGGKFAEDAKLDGRKLSDSETFDRLNPFNKSGYLNEQEYKNTYNPDGTLRNPEFNMMDYLNEVSTPALETVQKQQETHTMPDGTVMPGATHSEYEQMNKPALKDPFAEEDPYGDGLVPGQEGFKAPIKESVGILASIADSLEENDGTGTATNNNRENTATAEELKAKKEARDRRNEMLIRVGGAIMGGAGQGNLAAMSAGTKEYGRLADYNRALEQQREENELARQQKLSGLSATERKANNDSMREVENTITKNSTKMSTFQGYLDALNRFGDGVTGPIAGTVGKGLDAMGLGGKNSSPRSVLRLGLEEITVDKSLQKIAETKGAISNREMALFLKPTPKIWMDEDVWKLYLQIEIETARIMNERLSGPKNPDGTLVNRVDADREMDANLKAMYDQYMGILDTQTEDQSGNINKEDEQLFNSITL